MALLEVRQLTAGYRAGDVVRDVDIDVDAGAAVAILGRNGAGKTTFLGAVIGLVRASGGSVRFAGQDLTAWRPDLCARAGIAIVPQGRRLFSTLTVEEHLALAARAGRAGNWTVERVYAEWPRLAECKHRRPGELSGGEQQILAIGRAVVTNPRLLLLDEPSEGLSPAHAHHLLAAIRQLSTEGLAIVLVEQNLRLAFAVAGDVVVMEKGRFVHRSDVESFRRDATTARRLLGVG